MRDVDCRTFSDTEIGTDADEMPIGANDRAGAKPRVRPDFERAKQAYPYAAVLWTAFQLGPQSTVGQEKGALGNERFACFAVGIGNQMEFAGNGVGSRLQSVRRKLPGGSNIEGPKCLDIGDPEMSGDQITSYP